MARVTTEDCILYVPNRFKLVQLAAKRARELANGARTVVDGDTAADHKATVLALKESATGNYNEQKAEADSFEEFSLFEDDEQSDEAAIDAQLKKQGQIQSIDDTTDQE